MRTLFFLSLLANFIFFLWHYRQGDFKKESPVIETTQKKQIWLVSEIAKKPDLTGFKNLEGLTMATTFHSAILFNPPVFIIDNLLNPALNLNLMDYKTRHFLTTQSLSHSAKILSLSEFKNKTSAFNWLTSQATPIKSQTFVNAPKKIVADYLVYYPAASNFEDSKKNIVYLKAQGVTELFMFKEGEWKGAISLGVFKNEMRAIKAQQTLKLKGVNAQLQTRYKNEQN